MYQKPDLAENFCSQEQDFYRRNRLTLRQNNGRTYGLQSRISVPRFRD